MGTPNEWALSRQGNYHFERLFSYEVDGKSRDILSRMIIKPIYGGWNRGKWKWKISYRKFGMSHVYGGVEVKLVDAMSRAIDVSRESIASHDKYPHLG